MAALGAAVGLVLALVSSRALEGMLYGVSPSDPSTLAAVIGLVLLVTTTASLVPAVRASRVDPMRALHSE